MLYVVRKIFPIFTTCFCFRVASINFKKKKLWNRRHALRYFVFTQRWTFERHQSKRKNGLEKNREIKIDCWNEAEGEKWSRMKLIPSKFFLLKMSFIHLLLYHIVSIIILHFTNWWFNINLLQPLKIKLASLVKTFSYCTALVWSIGIKIDFKQPTNGRNFFTTPIAASNFFHILVLRLFMRIIFKHWTQH